MQTCPVDGSQITKNTLSTLIVTLTHLTGFPGSAERHSEEDEPQGLMFHGIILRSQLVTLLKNRVFYSENSEVGNNCTVKVILLFIM